MKRKIAFVGKLPGKRKKRHFNNDAIGWVLRVMGLIFGVVILMGLIIFLLTDNSSPQFKITRTECWNRSELIRQELIDKEIITCNVTITHIYMYGEEDKFCYDESYGDEYQCNATLCRFFDYYGRLTAIVKEEDFSKTNQIWKDIIETWKVCEEVEVGEIKIYEHAIWRASGQFLQWCEEKSENISWSDWDVRSKCSCNASAFSFEGNESYVRNKFNEVQNENKSCSGFGSHPHIIKEKINITISKQDLTIDWLNEFCECEKECVGYINDRDQFNCLNCDKYFCGDYTIEVFR